jgi:hypothetical protein
MARDVAHGTICSLPVNSSVLLFLQHLISKSLTIRRGQGGDSIFASNHRFRDFALQHSSFHRNVMQNCINGRSRAIADALERKNNAYFTIRYKIIEKTCGLRLTLCQGPIYTPHH